MVDYLPQMEHNQYCGFCYNEMFIAAMMVNFCLNYENWAYLDWKNIFQYAG